MYYNTITGEVLSEGDLNRLGFQWDLIKTNAINDCGIYKLMYNTADYEHVDTVLNNVALDSSSPRKLSNTTYSLSYTVVSLPYSIQLSNISSLAAKLANEARAAADATTNAYLAEFSETEKLTFPKQAEEVHAYLADSSAPTPTLDALASVRGIGREEQLAKAVVKVQAFEQLSIAIVGQQQAYEDTIKSIVASDDSPEEKVKALRALTFTYGGSGE